MHERCALIAPCQQVLEGGSIHVDGEGTLLTTEECLLHCSRNPHLSKQQIEEVLKETLGVSTVSRCRELARRVEHMAAHRVQRRARPVQIIWLDRGLYNDNDTNGHIDNICCFVKPGEVLLAWTDDENDPQYAISLDAYERLSKAVDAKVRIRARSLPPCLSLSLSRLSCTSGAQFLSSTLQGRKLVVHKIHQPMPLFRTSSEAAALGLPAGTTERLANERLAASYVNFFIGNQGVVVPGFGDAVYDEVRERVGENSTSHDAIERTDTLALTREPIYLPCYAWTRASCSVVRDIRYRRLARRYNVCSPTKRSFRCTHARSCSAVETSTASHSSYPSLPLCDQNNNEFQRVFEFYMSIWREKRARERERTRENEGYICRFHRDCRRTAQHLQPDIGICSMLCNRAQHGRATVTGASPMALVALDLGHNLRAEFVGQPPGTARQIWEGAAAEYRRKLACSDERAAVYRTHMGRWDTQGRKGDE